MKLFNVRTPYVSLAAVSLITLTLFTACNNPAAGGRDHHEHKEPFGLELVYEDTPVIRYFDREVTEQEHMHLQAGEEYVFTVQFLDEDGEPIHAEDFDESYHLGWVIQHEDVLQISPHEGAGKWSFILAGVTAGETRVQFRLMHGAGDHAHADMETPGIQADNAIEFHVDAEGQGEAAHHDEH